MASILVIDDDIAFAELTKRRLERSGMMVTITAEPASAVPLVLSQKFQVVLLDLSMPSLNGDHLLGVLRNLPAADAVRVLIYSSADEERIRKVAEKHDADYLSKSASSSDLIAAVTKTLERPPRSSNSSGPPFGRA